SNVRHRCFFGCVAGSTTHRTRYARPRAPRTSIRLARPLGASPRNRTSRRLLGEIGRGFFQNVALHLQLRDFPAQALDLRLFRLHDALPWERKLWIRFVLPDPTTQEIRMNIQIPRRLSCCDPAIRDQLYRLDLKLPAECSPCHLPPPVPFST